MGISTRSITLKKGFTLIELVMVIVILGILAAVALPKFVDLSTQVGKASTNGVAGAISAGSAANFAAKKAGAASVAVDHAWAACSTQAAAMLQGGAVPTGFVLGNAGGDCSLASVDSVNCTLANSKTLQTVFFVLYCNR